MTSAYKPAEVASWEGLLFPDTYEFDDGATAQEVLQTMATKMEDVLDELGYDKAETLQGRTAYELVIIASLIDPSSTSPEAAPPCWAGTAACSSQAARARHKRRRAERFIGKPFSRLRPMRQGNRRWPRSARRPIARAKR